jgi:hypothetical protein
MAPMGVILPDAARWRLRPCGRRSPRSGRAHEAGPNCTLVTRTERLHRDVEAYRPCPPTLEETELASVVEPTAPDDGTDWEALYADILA